MNELECFHKWEKITEKWRKLINKLKKIDFKNGENWSKL